MQPQRRAHDCAQLGIYARSLLCKLLCNDGNNDCNNICSNENDCAISEAYYPLLPRPSLRFHMRKKPEIAPPPAGVALPHTRHHVKTHQWILNFCLGQKFSKFVLNTRLECAGSTAFTAAAAKLLTLQLGGLLAHSRQYNC